jgi:hypothetical protein
LGTGYFTIGYQWQPCSTSITHGHVTYKNDQIKRIHSWISLEGPLSAPITNKSPEGGAFLLLFGLKSRLSLYTRAQILKLEAVDRDLELPMCYY